MKKALTFIALVVFISSCVINRKASISSNASISNSNFRFIKSCNGSSSSFHIIGIGGFDNEALMALAKENLYAYANLESNQVIANITSDDIYKYLYPLVYEHKIVLTGDVIEFIDPYNPIKNKNDSIKTEPKINDLEESKFIENVIFYKDGVKIKGKLMNIINGYAIIRYRLNSEEKTTDKPINEIEIIK
jgi:hypothetical protein